MKALTNSFKGHSKFHPEFIQNSFKMDEGIAFAASDSCCEWCNIKTLTIYLYLETKGRVFTPGKPSPPILILYTGNGW